MRQTVSPAPVLRCPCCGHPMVIGTVLLGSPWVCPKGAHKKPLPPPGSIKPLPQSIFNLERKPGERR